MAGSLIGGVAAILFGQAAADTASAFVGVFAFVFTAGLIAPSHRQRVGLAAASLATLLALGNFVLSVFTTVEAFSALSPMERVLTPVAQVLGAVYALFIFPPLVTPGTTLEQFWREIVALGTLVAMFGATLTVIGVVIGLLGHGWLGLGVGLGVSFLGAITWLFPFVHVRYRMRNARAVMEGIVQDMATREQGKP